MQIMKNQKRHDVFWQILQSQVLNQGSNYEHDEI